MAKRRLLISYAHPDDESFGLGALITKYVNEDVEVYLICATDGDMGTIPEDMQDQYDSVRELRLSELDCAAQKLNLKQVFLLGYKDSGMMGAESTQDPDCLWRSYNDDPQDVTRRVVAVIREVQPHVVVTFNQYGGYGHPDHIAIQRATTTAFRLASKPDYLTDDQQAYQPQKLYYSGIPGLLLRFRLLTLRLQGKDPRRMGVNKDIDLQAIVDHLEPIHTKVPIAPYFDAWDEASACHKSQGGVRTVSRTGKWVRHLLFSRQGFTRVYPEPEHQHVDESDLFAGVVVEDPAVEMA